MQEIKERKSNNSPGPDSVPPGGHGEQSDRTLSSSTRTSLPPSPVEGNVQAEQKHTDPRLAGTRRLMTETPGPPYSPPHQPIRGGSYTLQPSPQIRPVKTLPPKLSRTSGLLSTSCPLSTFTPLQTTMIRSVWPHCVLGT